MLQKPLFWIFRTEWDVRAASPASAENSEISFGSSRSQYAYARSVRMSMFAQPTGDGLDLSPQTRIRELRITNG
jgi:hypothetical protein